LKKALPPKPTYEKQCLIFFYNQNQILFFDLRGIFAVKHLAERAKIQAVQ